MISFRMFTEFVKCRDVEKIQRVLAERQYELDQTDNVRTHYTIHITSIRISTVTIFDLLRYNKHRLKYL